MLVVLFLLLQSECVSFDCANLGCGIVVEQAGMLAG